VVWIAELYCLQSVSGFVLFGVEGKNIYIRNRHWNSVHCTCNKGGWI